MVPEERDWSEKKLGRDEMEAPTKGCVGLKKRAAP